MSRTRQNDASLLANRPRVITLRAPNNNRHFPMSQHRSLKSSSSVGAKRSVLKRFERIDVLKRRGQWQEGKSPIGLPKTEPEA